MTREVEYLARFEQAQARLRALWRALDGDLPSMLSAIEADPELRLHALAEAVRCLDAEMRADDVGSSTVSPWASDP
jgi:hypothetical protein